MSRKVGTSARLWCKEERIKRGSYTGRELCESGEVTNATDEGEDADGDEMRELLKLKKQVDEEEEARVAAEATAGVQARNTPPSQLSTIVHFHDPNLSRWGPCSCPRMSTCQVLT